MPGASETGYVMPAIKQYKEEQAQQNDPSGGDSPGGTPQQQIVPKDNRVIPDAGVYGQRQADAELAYQNSVNQAKTRMNSLYHQYGLTSEGKVDPFNDFGTYQSMLQTQGAGLDQVQNDAMARGLGGGPGLGNQAERGLRYANAVQNLGFQGDVNQVGTDYGISLGDAESTRRNAMAAALQEALNAAMANKDYTEPDMSGEGGGGGVSDPASYNANLNILKAVTMPTIKGYGTPNYTTVSSTYHPITSIAPNTATKPTTVFAKAPTLAQAQSAYQAAATPVKKKR